MKARVAYRGPAGARPMAIKEMDDFEPEVEEYDEIYEPFESESKNYLREFIAAEFGEIIEGAPVYQARGIDPSPLSEDDSITHPFYRVQCVKVETTWYVIIEDTIIGYHRGSDEDRFRYYQEMSDLDMNKIVSNALEEYGISNGFEQIGFKVQKLSLWGNPLFEKSLEQSVRAVSDLIVEQQQEYEASLEQSLAVASTGFAQGLFEEKAMLIEKLVQALERAGDEDAEERVGVLFRRYGNEFVQGCYDMAKRMVELGGSKCNYHFAIVIIVKSFNKLYFYNECVTFMFLHDYRKDIHMADYSQFPFAILESRWEENLNSTVLDAFKILEQQLGDGNSISRDQFVDLSLLKTLVFDKSQKKSINVLYIGELLKTPHYLV